MVLLVPWVAVLLAPALWVARRVLRIQGSFWRLLGAALLFYVAGFGILGAVHALDFLHIGLISTLGLISQLCAVFLAFMVVTRAGAMRSLAATLIAAVVCSVLLGAVSAVVWRIF